MKPEKIQKLISEFKKIQKIPYQVCRFDEENLDESISCGDCRHKSELLYRTLKKQGFDVKKTKAIFDWKDLPFPKNFLNDLSKTKFPHNLISVKINDKWIKVDCTWQPKLEEKGFPVTKDWDGMTDTKQITTGKVLYFDNKKDYIEEIKEKEEVNCSKEEAWKFAEKLNKWLKN